MEPVRAGSLASAKEESACVPQGRRCVIPKQAKYLSAVVSIICWCVIIRKTGGNLGFPNACVLARW